MHCELNAISTLSIFNVTNDFRHSYSAAFRIESGCFRKPFARCLFRHSHAYPHHHISTSLPDSLLAFSISSVAF